MKSFFLTLCLSYLMLNSFSQASAGIMPLWPDGAPGAMGSDDKDKPELTVFKAANPNGAAVVICPGGGYVNLSMDKEGYQFAEWFNQRGVTAFVLKYRLGSRTEKAYRYPAQFDDATRAMRLVRSKAAEFGINPSKTGIMGFSAGGHLASTVGTHFDSGDPSSVDPVEHYPSRPDFMILAYPVISLTSPATHRGSREALLGADADKELAWYLSSELQVNTFTPPAFLFHTTTDASVPVENSLMFYQALRNANVPAEMHIFEKGNHGVGMAKEDPALSLWSVLLENWMVTRGIITR
jgi:acetyl esterase/lipase